MQPIYCNFFLAQLPFRERYFITAWHSFAVKSQLLWAILISDLQQTFNNRATIMKFRSDVYKTINFAVIKVLLLLLLLYVVQWIILWIGHTAVMLCNTGDMWSHEMVPCLFFFHPSKKQFCVCACGVFRKSLLWRAVIWEQQISRMSQFKQRKNVKFCQNDQKRMAKKPWAVVVCLSGTNVLHIWGGGGGED
jgi:hypothetical protein